MRIFRRRRIPSEPPPPICIWPDCSEIATVEYVPTIGMPEYCEQHADEMDRVDAELGFPGAKTRA